MPLHDLLALAVRGGASLALTWAAVSDVRTRTIPNSAILAVLAAWAAGLALGGAPSLGFDLLGALAALVIGFGLWSFRVMGAGDAKLVAAAALLTGYRRLPELALAIVLIGGVLGVIALAARLRPSSPSPSGVAVRPARPTVPYGVAIALAALGVIWGAIPRIF